jgi:hypothetical protein
LPPPSDEELERLLLRLVTRLERDFDRLQLLTLIRIEKSAIVCE